MLKHEAVDKGANSLNGTFQKAGVLVLRKAITWSLDVVLGKRIFYQLLGLVTS